MSSLLKKRVDDAYLNKKKVLVRVDFNVPIKDGEILDDFRIRAAVPTIEKILQEGGCAILMSHLGRPAGVSMKDAKPADGSAPGFEAKASLKPVAARLSKVLAKEVTFAPDCLSAKSYVKKMKAGDVLLLENVRFYKEEGSKKPEERAAMAKILASYGDVFVSDAFGTAHRDSATMTGIPKELGSGYAGYLMAKEMKYFSKVLTEPPRPLVAIVGGAKVSDKIMLLENMLDKINYLIIGGAMAYTFQKAAGISIGISMCEEDKLDLARELLKKAEAKKVEVFLPVDHLCNKEFKAVDAPLVTEGIEIPDGYMALDIGPKTITKYVSVVEKCHSCIWNGPMGVFEMPCYAKGTFAIAKVMADMTAKGELMSIIGGGDSASAAEKSGQAPRMSHISTGGGASLELLEGKVLPGVAILDDVGKKCSCGALTHKSKPASQYELVRRILTFVIGLIIGRLSVQLIA